MCLLRVLFLTSFLFMGGFTQAQTEQDLIGTWRFAEMAEIEELDSVSKSMARAMFGDFKFTLSSTYHYKLELFSLDFGSWEYLESKSELKMTSSKGEVQNISILAFDENRIILGLGKAKLVCEQVVPAEEFVIPEPTFTPLVVNREQLFGTWVISGKKHLEKTAEQNELGSQFVKGGTMQFKPNGKAVVVIMGIKVKGKWNLANENTSIEIWQKKEAKLWQVRFISDNKMELQRGNMPEFWQFDKQNSVD